MHNIQVMISGDVDTPIVAKNIKSHIKSYFLYSTCSYTSLDTMIGHSYSAVVTCSTRINAKSVDSNRRLGGGAVMT